MSECTFILNMYQFASGESFCAANDHNKKLCVDDVPTVLVDQNTGRLDLFGNLTPEELSTINRTSWEFSEIVGSANGPFIASQGFSIGAVQSCRRKCCSTRFVVCIAFVVDAEASATGEVKARDLLIVDRELKPENLTAKLLKKISTEPVCHHVDIVPLRKTYIVQRLHSESEHLRNKAQSICTTLSTREHLACISKQTTHLDMDAQLAGLLSVTMKNSPALLQGFLRYSRYHSRLFAVHKDLHKESSQLCAKSYRHIIVHLSYPQNVWLDFLWFFRLEALLRKQIMLDDLMNWLSTLGGAYSSLGDYFRHHAENAGKISQKQLRVAVEMGSPPLFIRCCLFYSLSLMQTGQLQRAKHIIRKQYRAAKELPITDERLLAMCRGIWNRLRYLWQKERNVIHSQKNCTSLLNVQEQSLR